MFKIVLKNDIHFFCEEGISLLSGAQKENINLNYSCKTGRCQSCKVKVLRGTSVAKLAETGLSTEDRDNNYILACVRTPTSDLVLDIEDLSDYALEPIRTFPAKIDALNKVAADVMELKLRIPPQSAFKYLSGQYINIIKGDYKRSYSLANATGSSCLILYIKKYPGGNFSNYLFHEARVNDLLRIEGPLGTFFYRKTEKKNIVFLATGTGIAPVIAILEDLYQNKEEVSDKDIYVFWGGRVVEDLFWKPEYENFTINFIPVLSRSDFDWSGEKGHVQDILISKSIDLSDTEVYACGSENMIRDAQSLLIKHGLSEKSFYSDAFVSTK